MLKFPDERKQKFSVRRRRRRTLAQVQKLVAEFVSSGMRRSEFCRSRGLSFSTLARHLKKRRWKTKSRTASAPGVLLPVEFATRKSLTEAESGSEVAVILAGGRRIEVQRDFDVQTFKRLLSVLEQV